jgi:hypothetical protein
MSHKVEKIAIKTVPTKGERIPTPHNYMGTKTVIILVKELCELKSCADNKIDFIKKNIRRDTGR